MAGSARGTKTEKPVSKPKKKVTKVKVVKRDSKLGRKEAPAPKKVNVKKAVSAIPDGLDGKVLDDELDDITPEDDSEGFDAETDYDEEFSSDKEY